MIVHGGFQGFGRLGVGGFPLGFQVFPAHLCVVVLCGQGAFGVEGVFPQRIQHLLAGFLQRLLRSLHFGQGALL